jgi:hypothetical protein
MTERNIIESRVGDGAGEKFVFFADSHGVFRTGIYTGYPDVGGQDCRQFGIQFPSLITDYIGQFFLHFIVNLRKSKVSGILFAHEQAASHPGQRRYLYDSTVSFDFKNTRTVGDINVFYRQRIENLSRGRPSDTVRHIMIADKQENSDPGLG